ncbi:hypothetical protein, partial [Aliiruegeria sabulilitoris]|uniref:hypothetical protein n=1 Tax=Aliiruegeria sabulilitoris TaxID=1510458 RepID=UPI0018D2360D
STPRFNQARVFQQNKPQGAIGHHGRSSLIQIKAPLLQLKLQKGTKYVYGVGLFMPVSSDLSPKLRPQLRRQWPFASGIGAAVGAGIALLIFLDAAFMKNPTGEFGWHLVGFAFLVGLCFSLGQWIVLNRLATKHLQVGRIIVGLWVPASTAAIIAMLLPLWWVPAGFLMWFPWLLAQKMLPGILALATVQWLILTRLMAVSPKWIFVTVLGAVVGAMLGVFWLIVLMPFAAIPGMDQALVAISNATFEMGWAFVTAGAIGLFQAGELARAIGKAANDAEGE